MWPNRDFGSFIGPVAVDGVEVPDVEPVPVGGAARGREPLQVAVAGERVAAEEDLGVGQRTEKEADLSF